MTKDTLEKRAKRLLEEKIMNVFDRPNPFAPPEVAQELNYLEKRGYISRLGKEQHPSFYSVTEKGRRWALRK